MIVFQIIRKAGILSTYVNAHLKTLFFDRISEKANRTAYA